MQTPRAFSQIAHPLTKNSQGGFSLIEMVVTCGVIAAVGLISANLMSQINTSNQKNNMQTSMALLRDEFISALQDRDAFAFTVAGNAGAPGSMTCITNLAGCTPGAAARAFNPFMRNNQPYLNAYRPATTATHGFRPDGTFCNNYSAAVPNAQCPIRINFTWRPICVAGLCVNPEVEIAINFVVSVPANMRTNINVQRFSTVIRRKSTFTAPPATTVCPANNAIIGFNTDGTPMCRVGGTL